jgi:hypothetical protein
MSFSKTLEIIFKLSKGAIIPRTNNIIQSYMSKFITCNRARCLVRKAVKHGFLRPTYRQYGIFQRQYDFLPSAPAITWEDEWTSWDDFFGKSGRRLYDYDDLHVIVMAEVIQGKMMSTWLSYQDRRKQDTRMHSRPSKMKGFTTMVEFFGKKSKPKQYCFAQICLLVRYAVQFEDLQATWVAYEAWQRLNPRCHPSPRLMEDYTNEVDLFGIACGQGRRKRQKRENEFQTWV